MLPITEAAPPSHLAASASGVDGLDGSGSMKVARDQLCRNRSPLGLMLCASVRYSVTSRRHHQQIALSLAFPFSCLLLLPLL